jgi:outer membrane protein OmpA-like peptidoglycan-associated protein
LKGDRLSILIDDPSTKAGDGFAYDFAKLLVNVKAYGNLGSVPGQVVDDASGEPIEGARVEAVGFSESTSDGEGRFTVTKVPAGLAVIQAGAAGYSSAQATVDVIGGEASEPVELRLAKSVKAKFTDREVRVGDSITLQKIQFDLNRAELRPEGRAELDKVAAFLKQNPRAEIHLSGHTSSEGPAAHNRELSFRRVLSCKAYLAAASIDPARITTAGHGPDQPVAPNDSEANRALNRRVEMRFTRL